MPSATSDKKWSPDCRIAVPGKLLEPQEIFSALQEAAGDAWIGGHTAGWTERAKVAEPLPAEGTAEGAEAAAPAVAQAPAPEFRQVWVDVKREGLRPAIEKLIAIHFPHFVVIAAEDRGEEIVLPYVFRLYHGKRHAEVMVTVSVHLPKAEPTVPSICDLIPGVLISEREKQEMMGVVVEGIPDGRRMFLPDDFPEGVYPWRKDETGPDAGMVRELWATGRPQPPESPQAEG